MFLIFIKTLNWLFHRLSQDSLRLLFLINLTLCKELTKSQTFFMWNYYVTLKTLMCCKCQCILNKVMILSKIHHFKKLHIKTEYTHIKCILDKHKFSGDNCFRVQAIFRDRTSAVPGWRRVQLSFSLTGSQGCAPILFQGPLGVRHGPLTRRLIRFLNLIQIWLYIVNDQQIS